MTPAMLSDLVAGDSTGVRNRGDRLGRVEGSVIVEFAILGGVAVFIALAVVQLAVFLFQRNVVVTAVAEGARVGASFGRTAAEGRAATCELIRQAIGERCRALRVTAVERGGLVVVTADGTLPPLAPGLPGLHIRHVATMHDEESFVPEPEVAALSGQVARHLVGRAASGSVSSPGSHQPIPAAQPGSGSVIRFHPRLRLRSVADDASL